MRNRTGLRLLCLLLLSPFAAFADGPGAATTAAVAAEPEASIKVLPREAATEPDPAKPDPEAEALFKSLTPEQQTAIKNLAKELEAARK